LTLEAGHRLRTLDEGGKGAILAETAEVAGEAKSGR